MANRHKFKSQKTLKQTLSVNFGWDVTALPAYTDEQSEVFITDLIASSTFLSKLQIEEGVKGTKTLKLLDGDVALQEVTGCTLEPDGAIVFSGRDISTKRLGVSIEFCNEDLNGKYTQMLNKLGANVQDGEMVLEPVIMAYLGLLLKRKAQRIMVLGDTGSIDPDLLHFDGLSKLITDDVLVPTYTSPETAWTSSNAFAIAKGVYGVIDPVVFDLQSNIELLTGRQEAQAIIDNIWNDKDFNAKTDVTDEFGTLSFMLPTTNIKVTTIPELNGTGIMFGFNYDYAFMGTDLVSDIDGLTMKADDYNDKLKAEAKFRLGAQFVLPQYFAKLVLTV
jgi:hypothetical protein